MVKDESVDGDKKNTPTEMFEAATNLILAVARGSVMGVGKGMTVLGHELEKFGEQLKGSDR